MAQVDYVADIPSLVAYNSTARTVIVQDDYRGGTFIYLSAGPSADNIINFLATGIGSGIWQRQFNEADGINVLWSGAVGDGGLSVAAVTGANTLTYVSGTLFSNAKSGQTLTVSNVSGSTYNTLSTTVSAASGSTITLPLTVSMTSITVPSGVTVTGSVTGGGLAAGTYYYYVVAVVNYANSAASASYSVVNTGSTSSNTVTWSSVAGATAYLVFRIPSGGSTTNAGYYFVYSGSSFIDTGAPFSGYATIPPYTIVKIAFGTDDTANIVPVFNLPYNVFFPSDHIFITSSELTNESFCNFSNRKISAYGSTIVRIATSKCIVFANVSDLTIEGGLWTAPFAIKGTGAQDQHCFTINSSTNINISNLHINGSFEMGIGMNSVVNAVISGNIIENCFRDGIYGGYSCNLKYLNNTLRNIQDDAMSIHDYGDPTQKINFPLNISQGGYSSVSGNIVDTAVEGFSSIGGAYISINNNQFLNTASAAISFINYPYQYPDTSTYNIWVNHADIENNLCENNCAPEIYILGEVFINNSPYNPFSNNGAGIAVYSAGSGNDYQNASITIRSNNVTIQDNKIFNCGCVGVLAHQIDGFSILNNFANNCNAGNEADTGNIYTIINGTLASVIGNQALDTRSTPLQKKCYSIQNTTGYTDLWYANNWVDSAPGEIVPNTSGSALIGSYTPDQFKKQVKAASTTNVTTLSGTTTLDGITINVGDLVLLKDQTTPSQNGIYIVRSGSWTRPIDCCIGAQLIAAIVYVQSGTINGGDTLINSNGNVPQVGTDSISFVYQSNQLSILDGNQLSAQTATVTVLTYVVSSYSNLGIMGYLNINSVSGQNAVLQISYTDSHGNSKTQNFFSMGSTTATQNAVGDSAFPVVNILTKLSSTVTISVIVSGTGSISFDTGINIVAF